MNAFFIWLLMLALSGHHGHRTEICPGAIHFFSGPPPAWAKQKRVLCRIGAHTFTN